MVAIKIKRTSTPNAPPTALAPGELSVEMADPLRLWVGVPPELDATSKKLLIDKSIGYLPLTGGDMTGPIYVEYAWPWIGLYATSGGSGFYLGVNGKDRWGLESGPEEFGTDFYISNYDDNGVYVGSTLTIVRATGNVGIGTDAPTYKLSVAGDVSATNFHGNGATLSGVLPLSGGTMTGAIQQSVLGFNAATKSDITTHTPSGFYNGSGATPALGWPVTTDWILLLSVSGGPDYSMQFSCSIWDDNLYFRSTKNASATAPWHQVYHSGNATNAIDNAKLADMPGQRIKGAVIAGDPQDLTAAQVGDILGTGRTATNFLRGDGTWQTPDSGAAGVTSVFGRTGAVVADVSDYSAHYVLKAGDTMTGGLNVVTDWPYLGLGMVNGAGIYISKAGKDRWAIEVDETLETGGNTGHNFRICNYADDGTFLGNALGINRATGSMTLSAGLTINGPLEATKLWLTAADAEIGIMSPTGDCWFWMGRESNPVDQRYVTAVADVDGFKFDFSNDNYTAQSYWLVATRNPGTYTTKDVQFPNGNVGIGKVPDGSYKLDVAGRVRGERLFAYGPDADVSAEATTGVPYFWMWREQGAADQRGLEFWDDGAVHFHFPNDTWTGFSEWLTVTRNAGTHTTNYVNFPSGNVGIGMVPTDKLSVAGNIRGSSIIVNGGGAYEAGSLYSDPNYGMIYRAKSAAPAIREHAWMNSAGIELASIYPDGTFVTNYNFHTNGSFISVGAVEARAGFNAIQKNDITTYTASGFWFTDTATIAEGWPVDANNWFTMLSVSAFYDYSMQFACAFWDNNLYYRSTANTSATAPWVQIIHTGSINLINNAMLADMPAARIKGAVAAGDPQDLTAGQVADILGTGRTAATFLRGDGTWQVPVDTNTNLVTSVFGRQGAIVASYADYAAHYVLKTGDTLTGSLTASSFHVGESYLSSTFMYLKNSGGACSLMMSKTTGANALLSYYGAQYLWSMNWGDSSAMSGGNAGANLNSYAYNDTGGSIGMAMSIYRATLQFMVFGEAYKPGGGSWAASSDERIKNVLGDYTQGLAAIKALTPVRYTYKGNDTDGPLGTVAARLEGEAEPEFQTHTAPYLESAHRMPARDGKVFVGLVAQAAEGAMPELVQKKLGWIDGSPVTDMRMLDPSALTYALINAVKELAAEVDMLKAALANR
jgi:hypothetical protein